MLDDGGQELRPATREEVMESLAYALRYQGRRRVRDPEADSFTARIAAECLAEHLAQSGSVVTRGTAGQAPSTMPHMPSRLPLRD